MATVKAESIVSLASVKTVNDAAIAAVALAESAQESADSAQESAELAQASADSAMLSSTTALTQLSLVEDVVGAINWISQHGTYALSADTEVDANKVYFALSGSGYDIVAFPEGNPHDEGYYELTSIDEAVTTYISSHLALTDSGLWLQQDSSNYRICITSQGVEIWSASGVVARYSTSVTLGDTNRLHIVLSSGELGFYDGSNKVAWVSSEQLYIKNATVTNELRIGNFAFVQRSGRLTLRYRGTT